MTRVAELQTRPDNGEVAGASPALCHLSVRSYDLGSSFGIGVTVTKDGERKRVGVRFRSQDRGNPDRDFDSVDYTPDELALSLEALARFVRQQSV